MTEQGKRDPEGLHYLQGLDTTEALRKRAEAKAGENDGQIPESLDALPPEASKQLLHDLRVHQIELEMQNEELRRAREELEASRARYFDLYDLAPVGYFTLSETGMILEANLTAAKLLGMARNALVKQPLSHFVFRQDQDIYYRHRKQLLETGAPQVSEVRLVRNGGAQFWARLEATTAEDNEGAPVCRAVVSDITERKEAEAERERLLASEQVARARADEAVRARDQFISVAAHELKTPITSIYGFAQVVLRDLKANGGADPVRLSMAMGRIERQCKRLTLLSGQLLDLSRIQLGRLSLSRVETSLTEMAKRAIEDERYIHPQRVINLHDGGPDSAFVDPLRLEQVLVNLIDNAIKFSPADSRVDVDTYESEPGWAMIAVRDRGIGISEEQREHIFERYNQADSQRYSDGMGLGLFISAQIVELHGGTITCEAPKDGGSRFMVRLPIRSSYPESS